MDIRVIVVVRASKSCILEEKLAPCSVVAPSDERLNGVSFLLEIASKFFFPRTFGFIIILTQEMGLTNAEKKSFLSGCNEKHRGFSSTEIIFDS